MTTPASMAPVLRLLFLLLALSPLAATTFCYWPNGESADENTYVPCVDSKGAGNGVCCQQGDICIGIDLCQTRPSFGELPLGGVGNIEAIPEYYRPACTSDDWFRDRVCRQVPCADDSAPFHDFLDGAQGLGRCDGKDEGVFYCLDDARPKVKCGSGDKQLITIDNMQDTYTASPPNVVYLIPTTTKTTATSSSSSSSSRSSSSNSEILVAGPPITAEPAPSKSTSPPPGAAAPAPTTTEPVMTPTTTPGAVTPQEANDDDKAADLPLAIGGAIGGISLLAAGVLAFFIARRLRCCRGRRLAARAESPPPIELDGWRPGQAENSSGRDYVAHNAAGGGGGGGGGVESGKSAGDDYGYGWRKYY